MSNFLVLFILLPCQSWANRVAIVWHLVWTNFPNQKTIHEKHWFLTWFSIPTPQLHHPAFDREEIEKTIAMSFLKGFLAFYCYSYCLACLQPKTGPEGGGFTPQKAQVRSMLKSTLMEVPLSALPDSFIFDRFTITNTYLHKWVVNSHTLLQVLLHHKLVCNSVNNNLQLSKKKKSERQACRCIMELLKEILWCQAVYFIV